MSEHSAGPRPLCSRVASVLLLLSLALAGCTADGSSAGHPKSASPRPAAASTPFPLPTPTVYGRACDLEASVCSACPNPDNVETCSQSLPPSLLRPLRLPLVKPGESCPTTSGHRVETVGFGGIALGTGQVEPLIAADGDPLHGVARLDLPSGGWYGFKTLWFTLPSYAGPVLVRAARIDGKGRVAFGEQPSIGHLVIPPGPTLNEASDGYRSAPGGTYVESPGCYAWQVDGLDFSYVLVFKAVQA